MTGKIVILLTGMALALRLDAQVEPGAGQWKTWVISSGSEFRLPAPPDANATAAEIQVLLGAASSLTSDELAQIHFWDAEAPGYRWTELTTCTNLADVLWTTADRAAAAEEAC